MQKIYKKDCLYTIKEGEQSLLEEESGKSYIAKNIIQKMKQYLENII